MSSAVTMPMRPVGRSQLRVPIFGFGGAHLGEYYARLSEEQVMQAMEVAWREGVRYWDTAPWYGHGLSEHRIGHLLRRRPRDDFVLSTKVGRVYGRPRDPASYTTSPWSGGLPFELRYDYSYAGIMRSYEQSMLRLGLNRIDALAIHDLDRDYHSDEALERHWRDLMESGLRALEELKSAGEIHAIGAGISHTEDIELFVRHCAPDYLLVAMPYTLLAQDAARSGGGFDVCAERGVSIILGSPFASGILADPEAHRFYGYRPAEPHIVRKVEALLQSCACHEVALPAAALQFVLAHPLVSSVIPGAVSADQVVQNLQHVRARIPDAFWDELRERGLIEPTAPTPKCTEKRP